MKKFVKKFLSILILVSLIICIAFLAKKIYNELINEEKIEIISSIYDIINEEKEEDNVILVGISEKLKKNNYDNEVYEINRLDDNSNRDFRFYYLQLSDRQKIIYRGLYDNKNNLKQGDYVINFDKRFQDVLTQTNGSQILSIDYQTAIEAFMQDNPEMFYLDVSKMFLNIETTTKFFNTSYNVYIGVKDGIKYYGADIKNADQIDQEMFEIEKEKEKIMKDIPSSDYKKIKYIHDYLIDNIEYDSTYNGNNSYNIYGALVKKKCVCEGYAKAFKYLANCAGLECELVQGTGYNSSGNIENHEWNCIKLNGIWYYVDCTWDDPIIIGGNGKATTEMKNKYFLKGSNTFEKDHILSYQFSEGGKIFEYPSISQKDYNK